jgi:trans-aconitate 2-methyltransferase
LRPFLEKLSNPDDQTRFLTDYLSALKKAYPTRADGRVLFPFRRLFLIAYR